MYDKKIIGSRIALLRKKRRDLYIKNRNNHNNMYEKYSCCRTQEMLAEKLEIERRTVGSWERGTVIPSLENLIKLCNLLECNIEYFLGADAPYIDTVSKVHHFTGILPEIVEYGMTHPDYLDCLNYFMLPENCAALFNDVTLSAWKTYWISQTLSDIKNPLLKMIYDSFNNFYSFTPFSEISEIKYKECLINHLPESHLNFSSKKDDAKINVKRCLSTLKYNDFFSKSVDTTRYADFIDLLVQYTYEPLINKAFLELQKEKLSKKFISTLTKYLSDMDG